MQTLAKFLLIGWMLGACAAHAQVLNTLGASPVSHFSETDNKLFMAAIDRALAEGKDGQGIEWKNDSSAASGMVTVLQSSVVNGMKCRELRIANAYKTLRGEGTYTFCQNSSAQWKLLQ